MSDPIGVSMSIGAFDPTTDIVARMGALDARLQAIDARWQGLGAGGILTATSMRLGGGTFAGALGAATTGAGGPTASPPAAEVPGPALPSPLAMVDPVVGATVSQAFGPTTLELEPSATVDGVSYPHYHGGLDLAAAIGTTVRAAASGIVVAAGRHGSGSVIVRIRHDDGSVTLYGHLGPDIAVAAGDRVSAGQAIGTVGLTGVTTGPHLHFELIVDGRAVDPAPWLAAGHLPGAASTTGAASTASAASSGALTSLTAFDAVAAQIPYAAQIRAAAVAAGVDPLLLASLVRAESSFRADAVSPAGALGLAQLMPSNARALGITDPFDPAQNLDGAARYLAGDLRRYGRTDVALAAYLDGRGAVARAGGVPDYPSTHRYIARVIGYWSGYLDRARLAGVGGATP
jgi:murein DD-endopeptidase MepM/ murein hydrolase activator NlpD